MKKYIDLKLYATLNKFSPSSPHQYYVESGETVLSFQTTEGKHEQQIRVYVGDGQARNFQNGSSPFILPDHIASKWGSLFVKDESTVTVVGSTAINGVYGIWTIDGILKNSR